MVHALRETWRVLVPEGCLLDSRQIAGHSRVEVAVGEQILLAGEADDSVWIPYDVASDKALSQVMSEGWFALEDRVSLDAAWYFDTLDGLRSATVDDDIPISEPVLAKAQELMARHGTGARVRWNTKMVIGEYRKLSLPSGKS